VLESFGIETALDVTFAPMDAVHGFGRSTTLKLVTGKQEIVQKFNRSRELRGQPRFGEIPIPLQRGNRDAKHIRRIRFA